MDTKTVEKKMKDGELLEVEAVKLNVRSSAYNTFRLICDKEETYSGFVSCTVDSRYYSHSRTCVRSHE